MKTLTCLLFLVCFLTSAMHAAEPEKQYALIRLPDGRVLKNATPVKYTASVVVLKCNLGTVQVRYEFLPEDLRAELEQKRPGGARWFPGETSGNTDTINGQVFIQTKGNSSYKFGNFDVYAFDLTVLHDFGSPSQFVRLPKPINKTTSDADGKFTIKVPKDRPYFLFTQATRIVPDANNTTKTEGFEWRVPMSEIRPSRLLMLSNDNYFPLSKVEIERIE